MPNDENCSQRRFQVSSLAVRSGPWIQRSGMTAAQETAVNPRSETTLRAAARLSVLRNPSSMLSVSSTFLMPAFAQPSSDLRYPAAREVFWCRQSVILGVAAWTGTTTCASGASSAVLRESMRPNIPKSCPSRDLPPGAPRRAAPPRTVTGPPPGTFLFKEGESDAFARSCAVTAFMPVLVPVRGGRAGLERQAGARLDRRRCEAGAGGFALGEDGNRHDRASATAA